MCLKKDIWSEVGDRMPSTTSYYEEYGSTRQSNKEISELEKEFLKIQNLQNCNKKYYD